MMTKHRFFAVFCCVMVSRAAALGQTCDTTYTGSVGGAWQLASNWSSGEPDDTTVACIPANKTVIVWEGKCDGGPKDGDFCENYSPDCSGYECNPDLLSDGEAKAIRIERGGTVIVEYCSNLVIHEDSTVNGELKIPIYSNWLRIGASLTIKGAGGEITGDFYNEPTGPPPSVKAITTCAGGSNSGERCDFDSDCPSSTCDPPATLPTLTFAAGDICDGGADDGLPCEDDTDCAGVGTCEANDNSDKLKSLWVHNGLTFYVPVVNNAWIEADYDYVSIYEPSSGSGYWLASKDDTKTPKVPGELAIEAAVTGNGTWILDDSADAVIEFNAACTGLTGDFKIRNGTLVVNENLKTTGKLEFQTVSGSIPVITVAEGKTADFDDDP